MSEKCKHNAYWVGQYGTCMACRAEKAEQERDTLRKRVEDNEKAREHFSRLINEKEQERDSAIKARDEAMGMAARLRDAQKNHIHSLSEG